MTVTVCRFDMTVPDDGSGLAAALAAAKPGSIRRIAILAKVGGEYTDGARERAKAAVDALLAKHKLLDRSEMITVIGCEGASTPCGYALIDVEGPAASGGPARLAIGLAHVAPPDEAEFDKAVYADKVAAAVKVAMQDAGLTADQVVTAIVNVPMPTSGDVAARGRKARAVAALGTGLALGEVDRARITDDAIIADSTLYAQRAQTYIGPTVKAIEVIAVGNRPGAGGDLFACSTVTQDILDVRSLKRMLVRNGLKLDADGELADPERVAVTILKVGVGANGAVLGAPTVIYNSVTPPEKHIRAAASGAFGAALQTTRMFSTADPVQQAPLGGAHVCCILRAD